jgi:DNA-binding response OmpR family regulator
MRVLLVEDYEPLRETVCEGLREAGFAVDAAPDGESGLWYAISNPYDVIVLDLMLPRMDGLSILAELRKRGLNTCVLVLTARDTTDDRVKGLDGGADDYLVKPFAFKELLARVRALVRRKYDAKSPVIRVGDLEVETTTRAVRGRGQRIYLSPREYALLEYLASRSGEVVSRTDIWEHVYDFHCESTSNVVDVCVGHIRRKLEPTGLDRLIQTRRGEGYVLGAQP